MVVAALACFPPCLFVGLLFLSPVSWADSSTAIDGFFLSRHLHTNTDQGTPRTEVTDVIWTLLPYDDNVHFPPCGASPPGPGGCCFFLALGFLVFGSFPFLRCVALCCGRLLPLVVSPLFCPVFRVLCGLLLCPVRLVGGAVAPCPPGLCPLCGPPRC